MFNIMIFRDTKGQLIEILRENYTTDSEYYRAIMKTMGLEPSSKVNDGKNLIIDILRPREYKAHTR